jgi:hypothetical protein
MTNTNCLEGVKCPQCGNEDEFRIAVTTMATVTDDGGEVEHGDMKWDDTSYAECTSCDKYGTLSDFKAQREASPDSSPPPSTLLEALDYVRATLKLRQHDEATDDEVQEALDLASAALAGERRPA